MNKALLYVLLFALLGCGKKTEKINPRNGSITESVYASGILKSKNQYDAVAPVNGIIKQIFVSEGDIVKAGTPILSIASETQKLNKENAELAAGFSDLKANEGKLNEAKLFVDLARNKMKNDSVLFFRQKSLWEQQVGSKVELEQRELAYENSKTAWYSSMVKLEDLQRQLDFNSSQARNNLKISNQLESDFTLKSEIDGVVYSLPKSVGEIVGPQSTLAIIGDKKQFILEMQVDEFDILKIKPGARVLVTMDSYKGQVFDSRVTRIFPYMNERSKTFLVEAEFTNQPETLYPNITFEANIILQQKENTLLIPRNFLLHDSLVIKSSGDTVVVKIGAKDYKQVEIISGIKAEDELLKPTE